LLLLNLGFKEPANPKIFTEGNEGNEERDLDCLAPGHYSVPKVLRIYFQQNAKRCAKAPEICFSFTSFASVESGFRRSINFFFISSGSYCKNFRVHPLFKKADELSRSVIGAAIEVHRLRGPGLIESIYEKCMMRELSLRQMAAINQRLIKIEYKGLIFEEPLRFDVLVEDCLLLELKSVQEVLAIHKAQLLSYMKLLNVPVGLLINFHEIKLVDGIVRMILPGSNQ